MNSFIFSLSSVTILTMNFEISHNLPDKISSDIAVVFAFQDDKEKPKFLTTSGFSLLDEALKGKLTKVCKTEMFSGEKGEMVTFFTNGLIVPTRIVVIGLGKKSEFVLSDLRSVIGKFAMSYKNKIDSASFSLPDETEITFETMLHAAVESLLLGSYEFSKYKTKKKPERKFDTAIIRANNTIVIQDIKKIIKKAELYARATILARDLVNEQSAVVTPSYLANIAKDIAKASPEITCKIFNKEQAEKLGMEAFLGIARAAETPPKFIFLEYKPRRGTKKKKLALVGKGITFDSGGINVKPGEHMQDMKMDMAGAATVLAVFSVISEIKPPFSVMGIIAATPNLISGKGIVPGDVVKAMNGKTIEILNTDAEGRVTMADSLSYAVKQGATEIIDFATLTGACLVALGDEIAGLFANDRDFAEAYKAAAFAEGEKVWELPLEQDYKELNKSEVADIANIPSTKYAGTITAALFLQEFIGDTPWVHLDIAGPAFASKPHALGPKGGTGFGVRTVLHFLERRNQ
jgi:leucyl aminopeptidase